MKDWEFRIRTEGVGKLFGLRRAAGCWTRLMDFAQTGFRQLELRIRFRQLEEFRTRFVQIIDQSISKASFWLFHTGGQPRRRDTSKEMGAH
ncbi:hypothetical protein EYF80_033301 [Liparis tanakae]|uniref:Uncharacterized protein n=1 Tax=Liparis tanakae TaxID=230148 RepID=A0A4Z2GV67_9TELE|nr:hypothetical protein EYF80_033301 [Liparis tanakae]